MISGGQTAFFDEIGQCLHTCFSGVHIKDRFGKPVEFLRGIFQNMAVIGGMDHRQALTMVAVGIGPS